MRRSHLLISGVVMLVVVLGVARSGQAAVGNTALLLKQSPANGGTVTPGMRRSRRDGRGGAARPSRFRGTMAARARTPTAQ